jgi:hypothetical protein
MKKVGLADWRTSNGLPSASDPETEADRTPRESLLACMTANREPSNQGFEIDREATVCSASRRFLPFGRTPKVSNAISDKPALSSNRRIETLPRRRSDRRQAILMSDRRSGHLGLKRDKLAEQGTCLPLPSPAEPMRRWPSPSSK